MRVEWSGISPQMLSHLSGIWIQFVAIQTEQITCYIHILCDISLNFTTIVIHLTSNPLNLSLSSSSDKPSESHISQLTPFCCRSALPSHIFNYDFIHNIRQFIEGDGGGFPFLVCNFHFARRRWERRPHEKHRHTQKKKLEKEREQRRQLTEKQEIRNWIKNNRKCCHMIYS